MTLVICGYTAFASVTFNVEVPAGTQNCYICGASAKLAAWSANAAVKMNKVEGEDRFTLTISDLTTTEVSQGFKYLCGQDWKYVEVSSSGSDISNRTSVGNPNHVQKWKNIPPFSYDNVFDESVTIGGKAYKFQVMVPQGYSNGSDSYPVLYMAGFKQRYKNSGDDSEMADSHFSNASWDIPKYAGEVEKGGANVGIIVSFYASFAELTPYNNDDFNGTGKAAELQNKLINNIIPYVNGKYRTLTGKANTFIGGGGYAGLFALYTALDKQDTFGGCIAFSPAIWVNRSELTEYISNWTDGGGKFCITYTDKDVQLQKTDISNIVQALTDKGANVKTYSSAGLHSDIGWGAQFSEPYKWISGNESEVKSAQVALGGIGGGTHGALKDMFESRLTLNAPSQLAASDVPQVSMFQAIPATVRTGRTFTVTAKFSDKAGAKSFSYRMSHNYGTSSAIAHTENPDGTHTITINNAESGIYHFDIDYVNASGTKVSSLSYICVKVVDGATQQYEIVTNAYEDIDWSKVGFYKSNFHTHTTQSNDSKFSTAEAIDKYHNAGYKVLALTDHDYNPYPWELLGQFKDGVPARSPEELGMIAVPGIELSKDDRNNWYERGGDNFNHHNDLFTGRHGQEFETIDESFAYTQSLGGYIIVNHPGQYWSLDKKYTDADRNSPGWHAANFKKYSCLIGLEVYNQGNRRANDRILWDQILTRTMPERPVWGYSGDDMHNADQLFRNYQFMLMDEFSKEGLIEAFKRGSNIFSYESGGSGQAKAPRITSIKIDPDAKTITLETDAADADIQWIYGTDIKGGAAASTRKSSIVGRGKTFYYDGFQGSYVRAFLKNTSGETCTQPFGFGISTGVEEEVSNLPDASQITLFPNPTTGLLNIYIGENGGNGETLSIIDESGRVIDSVIASKPTVETNLTELPKGIYFVKVAGITAKVIKL